MKATLRRSLFPSFARWIAWASLGLVLLSSATAAQAPSRPPGPPSPAERARQPGPWDQDIHVYRVPVSGAPELLATFARGGVATVARLGDRRLIVAHQHFPANREADFDKVAVHFSSDEGRTWTPAEVIRLQGLPKGMRFPFDPTLVPLPDGRVRLYFTSRLPAAGEALPAIYSAISDNAVDYVFEPGLRFGIAGRAVIDCAVVLHRGEFHLFAPDNGPGHPLDAGHDPRPPAERPPENSGYHAVSKDGLSFTRGADVRAEGRRRWLGDAKSDGDRITFYGTGEGGVWTATSIDGTLWTPGNSLGGVRAADPGTVVLRDGALLVAGTGPPHPGTPSAQRRNSLPNGLEAKGQPSLPKIVLVGDSIAGGYRPLVAKLLEGKAVVVSPPASGGDRGNVLQNLEAWLIREKPAVVHLNCGLHDLKLSKQSRKHQVELAQYEANLRRIATRLQQAANTSFVFANTTPIIDERHAKRGADFDRCEADVQRYNAVAASVMREFGVPVHDLHGLVEQGGSAALLGSDGTHYGAAGYERLAAAVADCVLRQWLVRQYTSPTPPPEPSAQEAERYRKTEAARDATVPPFYRNLPIGTLALPADAAAWTRQRPAVHAAVVASLGDLPPRPAPQKVRVVSREVRRGYTLERVAIDNGESNDISALLLIPEKRRSPAPAILWLHSSTPDKNQIITITGGMEPLGESFVRAGYVVLAPDACWYGDRAANLPGGAAETYQRGDGESGRTVQDRYLKLNLWLGRTLWGVFVRDDQIALDYLASRPEVDARRIGATGMSMGSTRAWWLAAVDDRVAATVGVACLTRYQNLIAHGNLRAHGLYYFSYGLLKHFDTEGVLALISPRPLLALTGDLDSGSPVDGIRILEEKVGRVYAANGAADRFKSIIYPNEGHVYTERMRREMLAWFERWLQPGR
jgi:lysophospholipase L1-like esterase/dienelactone hydrolase